jgi:hypothetical protein
MKKRLLGTVLGMTLMAGSSAFAGVRFGVGVNIGVPGYYAPAPVVVARPPAPGPGYVWIDGFNGPTGFVAGYWALPPAPGAFWVAPSFVGGRFVAGYWGGRAFGRPAFPVRGAVRFDHGFRR